MSEWSLAKDLVADAGDGCRELLLAGVVVREITRVKGGRWYFQARLAGEWRACLADERPELLGDRAQIAAHELAETADRRDSR